MVASRTGVVVPIRGFALGKERLAAQLRPEDRAELARLLAERVVAAARGFETAVVSSDATVRDWARASGLAVLDDPGSLDAAARTGLAWSASRGHTRVVVAHADLPLVQTFEPVLHDGSRPVVVAVPCHRDDGTPVLSLPTSSPWSFPFSYGPASFRRHAAAARRLGMGFRVVRDRTLAFDVDAPRDLAAFGWESSRRSSRDDERSP